MVRLEILDISVYDVVSLLIGEAIAYGIKKAKN